MVFTPTRAQRRSSFRGPWDEIAWIAVALARPVYLITERVLLPLISHSYDFPLPFAQRHDLGLCAAIERMLRLCSRKIGGASANGYVTIGKVLVQI